MMSPICKLTMGKDAIVSILAKFIHPSEHIRRAYTNLENNQRVENLQVVRRGIAKISRKDKAAIFFVSDAFKTSDGELIELYAVPRYVVIKEEGPEYLFFENPTQNVVAQEGPMEMPFQVGVISRRQVLESDVAELRGLLDMDDDAMPSMWTGIG